MDYENPADNPCRFMPKQIHRAPLQAAVGLATSMMNYAPTTTTTITPLGTTPSTSNSKTSSLISPNSQTSSSNLMPSMSNTAPSHDLGYYYGDSSSELAPTSAPAFSQSHESAQSPNYSTTMMTPLRASSLGFNANPYSHRTPPPGNFIRTRTCLDDENFCSIVSVVRIEFLNDSLVSRFWAMERLVSQ